MAGGTAPGSKTGRLAVLSLILFLQTGGGGSSGSVFTVALIRMPSFCARGSVRDGPWKRLRLQQRQQRRRYCGSSSVASVASADEEGRLVQEQLGYLPSNFVAVSAWKRGTADGSASGRVPVAIRTYPLHGGAKKRQAKALAMFGAPFPTLYWLTCPDISKAVASLERNGRIGDMERRLRSDRALTRRLLRCHRSYAAERWDSLTDDDRKLLLADGTDDDRTAVSKRRIRAMLRDSGISGLNYTLHTTHDGTFTPTVKCLHTHYAHYRSQLERCVDGGSVDVEATNGVAALNPVGEIVHRQLQEEFPDLEL